MASGSKQNWLSKLAKEDGSDESLLPGNGGKARPMTVRQRRRLLLTICLSLAAVSAIGFYFSSWRAHQQWEEVRPNEFNHYPPSPDRVVHQPPPPPPPVKEYETEKVEIDPLGPLSVLKGPPTAKFRDNLRPDLQYFTSFPDSGWTNDVIAYINLIYLALITDRVPIVPVFTPSHIGREKPPLAFGDVFDVPRLSKLIGKPVLEWRDVKDEKSTEVEDIGCWSIWETAQTGAQGPRDSRVPGIVNIDISYTRTPDWIRYAPDEPANPFVLFWSLARLSFPDSRNANLVPPHPSPKHHVSLPPDEQTLCYDFMYYVGAQQAWEFEKDYSPAWRHVAQHLFWVPRFINLAHEYVNKALGLSERAETPPYIAVHVRHNDFQDWCGSVPLYDCFAKIPVVARRVQEVKDELFSKRGLRVNHVIMTSDERNQTWWQEVADLGWKTPDHSDTTAKYGDWYPPLIDAAIQSLGVGFVGTDRSTMSVIAKRRVESWSNGVTRLVRWGTPNADDH